ncbi:hypothetical protein EH165_13095 [Nakamurella antarctica]|uniref:Uncharacterized protein n=1 Tax=Nakamurella antarctica TaxID=1902245 RepID=A0A3G8ZY38_9ACTN|nr:DUF6544 family protein [Nakamurella antarctica]AZI58936.1 hypothetical protein EH165_13095 [Nakamurella antarctica]
MARIALVTLVVLHGFIHLLGFAKAFGLAEITQLAQPLSREWGLLWLAAGVILLATAVAVVVARRWWWTIGLLAVGISQVVIFSSWHDAKWGTAANVVLLIAALYGYASRGPRSLRTEFEQDLLHEWPPALSPSDALIEESDLAHLPAPVQRYLRRSGVVGRPAVTDFRATWTGRMRSGPDKAWMTFNAEQMDVIDPPRRYFFMNARMKGMPVDVFHAFDSDGATMRVRLLSAFTMVDAKGAALTRAETVTLFNDLCCLAPGALLSPNTAWTPIDGLSASAQFTLGTNTITAKLVFDDAGDLIDFVADGRGAMSSDGTTITPMRWTTPMHDYAEVGQARVATKAEVRWHPESGHGPMVSSSSHRWLTTSRSAATAADKTPLVANIHISTYLRGRCTKSTAIVDTTPGFDTHAARPVSRLSPRLGFPLGSPRQPYGW